MDQDVFDWYTSTFYVWNSNLHCGSYIAMVKKCIILGERSSLNIYVVFIYLKTNILTVTARCIPSWQTEGSS